VLRRLRLVGIFAGIVATSAAFWLLFLVVGLPLFPNLYPEGVIPTGFAWYVHAALATIPPLLSLLLTFFHGGLVAGGVTSASPGLNGMAGAALMAFGGFIWFVAPLVPSMWEPISNPGEVYTVSDNVGTLLTLTAMFCAVLPFLVLAGYLGARLGGRLRNGLRGMSAGRSGA
jgi:hypothetical protein